MNEDKSMKNKKDTNESKYGMYFLVFVVALYIILFFIAPEGVKDSLKISNKLLLQIMPIFILIIFFMAILNYFINTKSISKYVGESSGIKGWLLAIFTGIFSSGPIYIWYPLLKELHSKGMRNNLIAVFLYNRAIKVPILPMLIYYFGSMFTILLLFYMIIASIIEGKIIGMIEK